MWDLRSKLKQLAAPGDDAAVQMLGINTPEDGTACGSSWQREAATLKGLMTIPEFWRAAHFQAQASRIRGADVEEADGECF
eukprot:CAMPEP_0206220380 /NCGR_PEP_ID=MMETSP0047_2-20121206/4848_1 /ASSEMBLY_ACC=CAM_ASM_000192 /TAXON_ID=195065 /ORGANISM="Chroomonas mesostigmatica_cf, Strain CCMP1168" /LENGTH=80 /DNA_ID=CAMNT_0053643039 /DNA_START=381 /DNA_END=624 /DNA_ORIENTATION=+